MDQMDQIDFCRQTLRLFRGDVYFRRMLASMLAFQKMFDEAFRIFFALSSENPSDHQIFNLLGKVCKLQSKKEDAVRYYKKFIEAACPQDRQLSSALYSLAVLDPQNSADWKRKAVAAEKEGLPFLTIACREKTLLNLSLDDGLEEPSLYRKVSSRSIRLASIRMLEREKTLPKMLLPSSKHSQPWCGKLPSWSKLRRIRLLDFVPQSDVVHKNCMLEVTIIGPVSKMVSHQYAVQDANFDVWLLSLYNMPSSLIRKICYGTVLWLAHPYQRLSLDMKTMIRIDFPQYVKIEALIKKPCLYCGREATKKCSGCFALYCCIAHQKADWTVHKAEHKLHS